MHMASTEKRSDLAVVDVYPQLGREVYSTEGEVKALIIIPKIRRDFKEFILSIS